MPSSWHDDDDDGDKSDKGLAAQMNGKEEGSG